MNMKSSLLALAASTSLVACIRQHEAPDAVRRALPTAEQVRIKLPESGRSLGQLAEYYVSTRNVTRSLNGGTAWVLILVHTIVQFPVTSIDGDTYTWGPWSDALDPAEYKLDVRDVGDGTFEYQLSGRSKIEPGAGFEVVIDGVADPRAGQLQGNGRFLLDFEASRRVNPIDAGDARGEMTATYDLAARHLTIALDSVNELGEPVAADYAYNETADGGGDMVLTLEANAGGTAAQEHITLRSRWLASGAGRGDARLAGGDLDAGATASECWSTSFRRVFYTDSVAFQPTEGDEADCAFATADLPPAPPAP